jgi:hypothetical protein
MSRFFEEEPRFFLEIHKGSRLGKAGTDSLFSAAASKDSQRRISRAELSGRGTSELRGGKVPSSLL